MHCESVIQWKWRKYDYRNGRTQKVSVCSNFHGLGIDKHLIYCRPLRRVFFLFFSLSLTSFKERSRKLGGIKDIRMRLCKGRGAILKIAKLERENNDKIIPVLSHFYTKKVTMAFKATQIIPPPKMNWFNSESITQCPVSLEKHEEAIQFTLFPNRLSKWCQIMHFRLRWQTTTECIDWSIDHQS